MYTRTELESRAEIEYEAYSKTVNIEAKTMIDMAGKQIIPAVVKDNKEKAFAYLHEVCPAMVALRKPADELEMLVDKELWPFPSYGDLVFEV